MILTNPCFGKMKALGRYLSKWHFWVVGSHICLTLTKLWEKTLPALISRWGKLSEVTHCWGFPSDSVVKNLPANAGDMKYGSNPWVRKIPRSRKWQLTPGFLPGKFQGQRNLAGYSPWSTKELDLIEHTYTLNTVLSHSHSFIPSSNIY